jgi:branched-chain amino acid transport system substrate-binding protein
MTINTRATAPTRRRVLQGMGAGAAVLAAPGLARAQSGTINVGFMTPTTGPRAQLGATDGFTQVRIKAGV